MGVRPLASVIDSLPFEEYARRNLKIITMAGRLEFLNLNEPQLRVHDILEAQREAGLPMRAIVLKARREGVSTYVSARYFREVNRLPNRGACICSADEASTNKVFGMTKLFQSEIPADTRRETDYSSRKEIVYSAPHRSALACQTAGTDVLGRGGLTHYLHCTEFAFWSKAKEQYLGIRQEVPDDPETCIILESTANGTGGAFYDEWIRATDHWRKTHSLDGFVPIFLPWHIFPKYSRPLPPHFSPTAEERVVQSQYSLTDEQLYWRRWAIENKCQGDIRMFHQEYPITWQEAFQSSGSPVFTQKIMEFQGKFIRKDVKFGLFDVESGDFIEEVGSSEYGWSYLDGPGSEEHVIGVDTREHRLSDDSDIKSERDFDGVVVLGRKSGQRRVKAILHGKYSQKELGLQILGAAKHFNMAWVVPEIPMGMMVVQVLKDSGYPNIYHRQSKEFSESPEDSDDLGFRTTAVTRHYLTNDMIGVLRSDAVLVQFSEILEQMKVFIYDKLGRPRHMAGRHDDLMFGLALAIHGDLNLPKNNLINDGLPMFTDGDSLSGGGGILPSRPVRSDDDLAYINAYDDIDEYEEDDGWYFTE